MSGKPVQNTETSATESLVAVKNLQLTHGITAHNNWGLLKEQPALITINLHLSQGFSSAADKDALDQNTIHYGELAKQIRKTCNKASQNVSDVFAKVETVIHAMGLREDGSFRVLNTAIEILLPKASMYGDGMKLTKIVRYDDRGERLLPRLLCSIQDMKIMTLVGVNDYERKARQPVVAALELSMALQASDPSLGTTVHESGRDGYLLSKLSEFENRLIEIIQDSSFETLEALVDFTLDQLRGGLPITGTSDVQIKLRLEKPRAIAFADAAAVEALMHIPNPPSTDDALAESAALDRLAVSGRTDLAHLNVIKPYV